MTEFTEGYRQGYRDAIADRPLESVSSPITGSDIEALLIMIKALEARIQGLEDREPTGSYIEAPTGTDGDYKAIREAMEARHRPLEAPKPTGKGTGKPRGTYNTQAKRQAESIQGQGRQSIRSYAERSQPTDNDD